MKSIDIYGDGIGSVDYVEHMGDDLTIVNSARVSFGKHKESLDEKDEKLINYLVKHKHTSTFEHNLITFRFRVPLYVRSQHHRHRTWSYNEISRRYTDINIQFYEPSEAFRTQHKSNRQASNAEELTNPLMYNPVEKTSEAVRAHHETSHGSF
jgi:thymidylate synthase (FAD)